MTKNTTAFYVETGNWRASIILDVKADEVENYDYVEAATRSLEAVFSESKETLEGNFELVTLMDKKGRDYFDPEYPGELSDIPNTLFGLLTACFLENALAGTILPPIALICVAPPLFTKRFLKFIIIYINC